MIGLIPARGGSRTVLDKNLLSWDGQYPAVVSAARLVADYCERVIVSTDSPEIAAVAQAHGFTVEERPTHLASDEATIDELVEWYQSNAPTDDFLVILPTAAGVTHSDIRLLLREGSASSRAVALAVRTHGLIYEGDASLLTPRTNRQGQHLQKEVGVRYLPHGSTPFEYLPVFTHSNITEIDTPIDLMVARHRPKTIHLVYAESDQIGSGHKRRMTAVARELQHHNALLVPLKHFNPTLSWVADVVVLDILDTERKMVANIASQSRVMTVEDLGEGADYADVTVNALYSTDDTAYVDLRPEFWGLRKWTNEEVKNVLVTFGGTDPANLWQRFSTLLSWPERPFEVKVATRNDPVNMALAMMEADLVITSAGRTLHEAAYLGVPAISIAANIRETTHCHLGPRWGNVYLGHHAEVSDEDFLAAFHKMESEEWRWELTQNRYLDHLGVQRMARLVEHLAEE